ncbi:VOC family protein, partial [Streptomyces sp. NPDC005568]|uniref:VOC family protein n=1 Tax=Streptomyces sp. NPDC005568 TaxID=3156887 RepID=UPI0033A06938
MRRIALVTLVVDDYDEAIRFYTEALGFRLAEDAPRPDGSRWVVVEPGAPGQGAAAAAVTSLARYTLRAAAVYD